MNHKTALKKEQLSKSEVESQLADTQAEVAAARSETVKAQQHAEAIQQSRVRASTGCMSRSSRNSSTCAREDRRRSERFRGSCGDKLRFCDILLVAVSKLCDLLRMREREREREKKKT